MPMSDPVLRPIGVTINVLVASRIRGLVDEYGESLARGGAMSHRRARLESLLRAVLRSLRLEAVDGERYRLSRCGDVLTVDQIGISAGEPAPVTAEAP